MPIERELKFRLAPRAAPRVARELSLAKARVLHSIYFDTAERELRAARMALRLRREGRRWLQTLKCEISAAARHEWEMPAPGRALALDRFPADEVRDATGIDVRALSARLRPIFETRFTRRSVELRLRDGRIELALDRGAIQARGARAAICELELELKAGAPWALGRYAERLVEPFALELAFESKAERGYGLGERRALALPRKWHRPELGECTPGAALALLAGAALEQTGRNVRGFLESTDVEYLHQLRVGLRRFRVALALFKALSPKAQALKERLRALTPLLGEARDWDVFVQALSPGPLRSRAQRRQALAREKARRLAGSAAFQRFLVSALAWIEEAPWQPAEIPLQRFAVDALERLHRKAVRQARRMHWRDAAERHVLRIRVKRLRYACDSFADLFPAGAVRAYLAALEQLQDRLGELNDIATARRLLATLGEAPGAMRALAIRERGLSAGLPGAWAAFSRRRRFWKADT